MSSRSRSVKRAALLSSAVLALVGCASGAPEQEPPAAQVAAAPAGEAPRRPPPAANKDTVTGQSAASRSGAGAGRRAFCVGVTDYEDQEPLPGAKRDAERMGALLRDHYGYAPGDVRVLTGTVTRDQILEGLEWLRGAGSVATFYFSGHGWRVDDQSRDEGDGKDEAIVPSDQIVILDDELATLLGDLGGARVYAVLDSCHSESAGIKITPPGRRAKVKRAWGTNLRAPTTPLGALGPGADESLNRAALAACRDLQKALEVDGQYGLLTRNLEAVLQELAWSGTTAEVWARVAARVEAEAHDFGVIQEPMVTGPTELLDHAMFR